MNRLNKTIFVFSHFSPDLCLNEHNARRALHINTEPLRYNIEFERQAQEWADHLAKTKTFEHATYKQRHGLGENLAYRYSKPNEPTEEEAIRGALTGW